MLQAAELDVSPSSSFEYARNWRDYFVLPNHSISSVGPVRSVLLFSPFELAELKGQQIAITGESATSINLLRIIFREFYGLTNVTDHVPDVAIEPLIAQKQPALLIGDRALRLAQQLPEGIKVFDLGELWFQHTGLPFVFALWMIRRNVLSQYAEKLALLGHQLLQSRNQVLAQPQKFVDAAVISSGIPADTIVEYWNTIDYRLDDMHKKGLKLFFQLCKKYGFLAEEPELNFLTERS
jgi:chorismate dehydratase